MIFALFYNKNYISKSFIAILFECKVNFFQ